MVDENSVTVSTSNVHIPDSHKYNRGEVRNYLDKARKLYPNSLPLVKRTTLSLLREWASHKACYCCGLWRSRTASVDLNYPQRWWVRILYAVVGTLTLPFV